MKLVRNTTPDGACKYALVRLDRARAMPEGEATAVQHALEVLNRHGVLELGEPGTAEEFFAIKLKDPRSTRALDAYADAAHPTDPEFANEVRQLAERSGEFSPFCKEPD